MLNLPSEAASITELIQTALRERGQWSGELNFVRKDGAEGVCEAVVVLHRDAQGQPGATISVNRDVTARKLAELRAQQHQAELARVARFTTLGEMTAGIAHQLNQPLTALCNFVRGCERRMLQDGRYAPDMVDAMGKAVEQAERAADIIRRVRSLIRHEVSARTRVDLNTLLRGVAELSEVRSRRNGVPLRLELDPALPLVTIDPIQIEQMMINLIANAYDAIGEAGPGRHEVVIRTHTTPEGNVAMEVRDSGIGLTADNLDRAFEPFYSTKKEGLGIGLSISRTIADNNGGRLVAVPATGRGAVFRLTLPPTKGDDVDES
jgi:two-component system sensor kinase FixL